MITSWLALLAAAILLLLPLEPLWALSALDFPSQPPEQRVVDQAAVLSRATASDLQRRLEAISTAGVTAHLVTIRNLDYGLSSQDLARQLAERWQPPAAAGAGELLLLIDGQSNNAAIAVSPGLEERLPAGLLRSTASATMGPALRDGGRYRQASLDALQRLSAVLAGEEDPGVPAAAEVPAVVTNIPSREETASSNALRWVIVLLVVGSVVPMVTWWVFSR
ncbi:MAG: TPM domain-containing protein [Cyanobacteriota bacterium]|nr:TPM domain-containing protein [Cyanobacteriota bacterium]